MMARHRQKSRTSGVICVGKRCSVFWTMSSSLVTAWIDFWNVSDCCGFLYSWRSRFGDGSMSYTRGRGSCEGCFWRGCVLSILSWCSFWRWREIAEVFETLKTAWYLASMRPGIRLERPLGSSCRRPFPGCRRGLSARACESSWSLSVLCEFLVTLAAWTVGARVPGGRFCSFAGIRAD